MNNSEITAYIKDNFPINSTKLVADELKLSVSQVRTIAKKNGIKKCEIYLEGLKKQLIVNRKNWYEENIPELKFTYIQEQIILGSLFGDGYISTGAERSINCYYQEHFGENQRAYREWKLTQLKDLHFSIKGNYLRSISHPYFTNLRSELYSKNIKTATKNVLKRCTHPMFLATLYLDDGSLIISYRYNKKNNTVRCYPSIVLYTLNLTRLENSLLATHLNQTFKTNFVVSGHPDGHGSLLKLNKESEVTHFLNTINPQVKDITSMKYKTCVKENIKSKTDHIKMKYGEDVHIKISSSKRRNLYTDSDIQTIITLKKAGVTDKLIAKELDRTYWSVVYKIKELRKKKLL